MADILTDTNLGIGEIEGTKPSERSKYFDRMVRWIDGTAKARFKSLIVQDQTLERDKSLARIQKDLAVVLHLFRQGQDLASRSVLMELQKRSEQIKGIFFGQKNSYVDIRGIAEDAKAHLVGPISVLTFTDLMTTADPEVVERMNLSQVLADEDKDVLNKTDLILDFGDEGEYGKIIRLVQLKSSTGNYIGVRQVNPQDIREKDLLQGVTVGNVEKMAELAKRIEGESEEPVDVRLYLVTVPAYDSDVVNNMFGIITGDRKNFIERFGRIARKEGLLPK